MGCSTYPTTYAYITPSLGAEPESNASTTATCAQFSNVEELAVPATANPTPLFLPLGEGFQYSNGTLVSVPAPVLSYLETFQRAWPVLVNQELDSCLQFQAGPSLPASITGGFLELPCLTVTTSTSTTCFGSLNRTCATEEYPVTETEYPTVSATPSTAPVALATASILSKRTGAAVYTPAQVPAGILPTPTAESPDSPAADSVQNGPTAGSAGEQSLPTQEPAPSPNDGPADEPEQESGQGSNDGPANEPEQQSGQGPNDAPAEGEAESAPTSDDDGPNEPQQDGNGQTPTPIHNAPDQPQAPPEAASHFGTPATQGAPAQTGTDASVFVSRPGDPVGSYIMTGLGPGASPKPQGSGSDAEDVSAAVPGASVSRDGGAAGGHSAGGVPQGVEGSTAMAGTGPSAPPSVSGAAGLPGADSSATASISVPPSLGAAAGNFAVPSVSHLLAGLVFTALVL